MFRRKTETASDEGEQMDNRVGTCGRCGGAVVVPSMMIHPVPHCVNCGAIAKEPHGRTIPMQEPKREVGYEKFRELMLKPLPREF